MTLQLFLRSLPSSSFAISVTRSGSKPNFLCSSLSGRRGAERLHADDAAAPADISLPAESRGLLDRDARRHVGRQHAVPVLLCLVLENIPRRHRDHARADALGEQLLVGLHGRG